MPSTSRAAAAQLAKLASNAESAVWLHSRSKGQQRPRPAVALHAHIHSPMRMTCETPALPGHLCRRPALGSWSRCQDFFSNAAQRCQHVTVIVVALCAACL
jgi:hypothetical protein